MQCPASPPTELPPHAHEEPALFMPLCLCFGVLRFEIFSNGTTTALLPTSTGASSGDCNALDTSKFNWLTVAILLAGYNTGNAGVLGGALGAVVIAVCSSSCGLGEKP